MQKITQKELANIFEKIDNINLPAGYDFPSLDSIETYLEQETREGLILALTAAEKSEDKEYSIAVNSLIKEYVDILEDEKLIISYLDFEKALRKIDAMEDNASVFYPSIKEAEKLLTSKSGFVKVLTAAELSPDKEYALVLNDLIKKMVDIKEEEKDISAKRNIDVSKLNQRQAKRLTKIQNKVNKVPFKVYGFCPTKMEIDSVLAKDIKSNDSALAFLLWVSSLDNKEDATESMKNISDYAKECIMSELS